MFVFFFCCFVVCFVCFVLVFFFFLVRGCFWFCVLSFLSRGVRYQSWFSRNIQNPDMEWCKHFSTTAEGIQNKFDQQKVPEDILAINRMRRHAFLQEIYWRKNHITKINLFINKCLVFTPDNLSSSEMESVTQVQILDETVCVSFHANILRKGMNVPVLPQLPTNYG